LSTVPVPDVAYAIAPLTTLRLGGPARRIVEARSADAVVHAIRDADADGEPLLLLGGGSNVVVADEGWPGTVVRVASTGRTVVPRPDGSALMVLEAGEEWDEVVAAAVADGLGGLECLSGIPGRTGATPVQNVGASGVETAELGLAYRTSVLKGRADAVVLRVRLRLTRDGLSAPIRYAELARTLGVEQGGRVPVERAREAVLGLRRGKGMVLDPADPDTWSAGSFFTNPVLPEEAAPDGAPRWPAGDGLVKLPAAWLIEKAGFRRGHPGPGGRAGLSTKHVLALTNRGTASTSDLLSLAAEVRAGVRDAFGITLAAEPVLVGCEL
jgi:UDP-N-acetylmuramate dehydrogenase